MLNSEFSWVLRILTKETEALYASDKYDASNPTQMRYDELMESLWGACLDENKTQIVCTMRELNALKKKIGKL